MSIGTAARPRAFSSEEAFGEEEEGGIGWSGGAGSESSSDVGGTGGAQQADGEVTAGGEGVGDGAGAHLGAILLEGDVADVVEAVLDAPVSSSQSQERLGVGLLGRQAGDVVADLRLGGDDLAAPDLEAMPLDGPDLAEVRPGRPVRARAADVGVLLRIG